MVDTQGRLVRGVFNLEPYEIDYSLPAMEIFEKLPEMFPAEVIDNKLHVSPVPTYYHQAVSRDINRDLYSYVLAHRLGEVWTAPFGVFPEDPERTVVSPDIIFISKANPAKMERRGLFGVPDLIIEILSTNRKYDLVTKKNLYQRTGVRELWYIDPVTKKSTGYLLENSKYGEPLLMNSEIFVRVLNKFFKF